MAAAQAIWIERFNAFLLGRRLRRSGRRDLVARTFFAATKHIGIEELYRRVRKLDPEIGIATVYRTLNLLVKSGLAERREFAGGAATYEKRAEEHHDHLLCLRCGRIVEFARREIERLQEEVAARHGFLLRFHKMELYGFCAGCRAKGAPEGGGGRAKGRR